MAKKDNRKKLVLFDAHAILHRAYHALPDFTSSSGEPTGALYGVASMLMKIIGEIKPDYMAACYDLAEPTFRKQIYDDYKGKRAKTDDTLTAQMDRSREVFESFHIPIYDKPGFEADDIIGTIVEMTKKEKDLQVIIASGDMDTLQLVDDDRVVVFTLKKGINDTILYDEKAVKERFSFDPELLVDYKGLRGDPSDNIIGIPGIGEKTATILITKIGGIEKIYKKLGQKDFDFEKIGIKPRIVNLLRENEEEALFSKTLATIRRDAPIDFSLPKKDWKEVFEESSAEALFTDLDFRSLIPRLRAMNGENVIAEPDVKKEEIKIDEKDEKELKIALWLVNSELTTPSLEDVFNYTKTEDPMEAKKKLSAEIKEKKLDKVFRDIEAPLIPILERAQVRGILLDLPYLKKISKEYHKKLSTHEKKIYKSAGAEFNINSPKQLGEVLFDQMGLTAKGLKKTAGGARSTRESELLKLKDEHEIIGEILKYRELQKLLSTYIDNIPEMVGEDGRLHAKLHQTGTTTGRMSSSEPNLQNIPIKGDYGQTIRHAFVAERGYKWVAIDYSQIEMRVLAALSGDKDLIDVFKKGRDIHTAVASKVFGVKDNDVTSDMRRSAKVINFGIVYGMGVNALRQNIGGTRAEAQEFYDNYFKAYPTIKNYFESIKSSTVKVGYTETYFGRRRSFPGISSPLPFIRAMNERMAVNAPIQGTAADIAKIAIIRVDEFIKKEGLGDDVRLLLQVHDELIYEIKEDLVEKISKEIDKIMESIEIPNKVPLVANVSIGKNWGEAK